MEIPPKKKTDAERAAIRDHFLEPETRCDTEISVHTKKVWKCMLDILEQFIRICDKYDLKWSVTSGTLLGAIRHGGFIPWDEDLDVAMPRKDFNKFLKIAQKELPPPYMLQTWATDRDVFPCYARIRNSETTSIMNWYVEHHWKCNMGVFIDIYTIEGIPGGHFAHWFYNKTIQLVAHSRWSCMDKPAFPPSRWNCFLKTIGRVCGPRFLFKILNAVASMFTVDNCPMAGLTPFHAGIWKNGMVPSWYFSEYTTVDFEYLRVRVPVQYERVLGAYYGNWTKFVKGECGHAGTLTTDPNRSYRDVLPERFAQFGYSLSDFNNSRH